MNTSQNLCFNTNTQKVCLSIYDTTNTPLSTQVQFLNNQNDLNSFLRNPDNQQTSFIAPFTSTASNNTLDRYTLPVDNLEQYMAQYYPNIPQNNINVPQNNTNVPRGNTNVPQNNTNVPQNNTNVPRGNTNAPPVTTIEQYMAQIFPYIQ